MDYAGRAGSGAGHLARRWLSLVTAVGPGRARSFSAGRRPLKVIHAAGWYFPDSRGGTEIYVDAVARRLRDAGIDVAIAAPRSGAVRTECASHNGLPVYRYAIPARPTRAEVRGEQVVRGAEAFHAWLLQQKPDVVHVHTFVTGLDRLEIAAAKTAGARVFVTTHSSALGHVCVRGTLMRWGTTVCDGIMRPHTCAACALQARRVPRAAAWAAATLPLPVSRFFNRIERPVGTALGMAAYIDERRTRQHDLFSQIDRFFVLTERARAILLANGAPAAKVVVNRLGIDTDVVPMAVSRSRVSAAPITVGFLGRFDPLKGLDDLLAAIRALPASVAMRFDFRGISDQDASAALVTELGAAAAADPRIRLGAAVDRADVAGVLQSWDVLCCPGTSLEGGPTVALEAMAVGTPVITTRTSGVAEIIEHERNGAVIAPRDVEALTGVLQRLGQEPGRLDAWRSALPPIRTLDAVAAQYLEEYAA